MREKKKDFNGEKNRRCDYAKGIPRLIPRGEDLSSLTIMTARVTVSHPGNGRLINQIQLGNRASIETGQTSEELSLRGICESVTSRLPRYIPIIDRNVAESSLIVHA